MAWAGSDLAETGSVWKIVAILSDGEEQCVEVVSVSNGAELLYKIVWQYYSLSYSSCMGSQISIWLFGQWVLGLVGVVYRELSKGSPSSS